MQRLPKDDDSKAKHPSWTHEDSSHHCVPSKRLRSNFRLIIKTDTSFTDWIKMDSGVSQAWSFAIRTFHKETVRGCTTLVCWWRRLTRDHLTTITPYLFLKIVTWWENKGADEVHLKSSLSSISLFLSLSLSLSSKFVQRMRVTYRGWSASSSPPCISLKRNNC